ncbi:MAG: hypothetical protein J5379_01355 [Clostridiales bacterium]|nr:hypothetical protein [Clostridiales bacterium]
MPTTTVDLQDPFSYSYLPIVLVIALILLSVVLLLTFFLIRRKMKTPVKQKEAKPVVFKPKSLNDARREYLEKINEIERQYNSGKLDVRGTHQELSAVVRMFVHDMTGINAQNFSLQELKSQNVHQISQLIEEFYAPEFAERTDKETNDSIRDAREVISTWN